VLNLSPQTIGCRHPTRYNSHAPPLQHPSNCGHQLLVDCCLLSLNGSHLRPEPGVSLYFLMCLHLAPQTGKPAIALPNPTTGVLRGTIGSRGAIGWGRRYTAHGERGQSWRRVGWQRLILVVVFCVVCYGCDKPVLATLLVEKVEIRPAKMANFSTLITMNASLDAPNVKGCPKLSLSLDFGHVLTFGLKCDIGALTWRNRLRLLSPTQINW
jgi:hypothetical protein